MLPLDPILSSLGFFAISEVWFHPMVTCWLKISPLEYKVVKMCSNLKKKSGLDAVRCFGLAILKECSHFSFLSTWWTRENHEIPACFTEIFSWQPSDAGKEVRLASKCRQVCFTAASGLREQGVEGSLFGLLEGRPIIWTRWIMSSSVFFHVTSIDEMGLSHLTEPSVNCSMLNIPRSHW